MITYLSYYDPNGELELDIKLEDARKGYHQGQCDDDIAELQKVPYIKEQLNPIPYDVLAAILDNYGCEYDSGDDKEELEGTVLWLACGDVIENAREEGLL